MNDNATKKTGLSSEQMNLIIAVSAILISAASFYATFLQADSAEKQVRAMTMPMIQFTHGNYDVEAKQEAISLTLKNAGVGPAVIRSVQFRFEDEYYNSLRDFFMSCCESTYRDYLSNQDALKTINIEEGAMIQSTLQNSIIPGQSELVFFKMFKHELSEKLWESLNKKRWDLGLNICFCSLLEECFISENTGRATETPSCPTLPNSTEVNK